MSISVHTWFLTALIRLNRNHSVGARGARASRVRLTASRRQLRSTHLEPPVSDQRWVEEVCGATPQTTRRRRVLPIAYGIVTAEGWSFPEEREFLLPFGWVMNNSKSTPHLDPLPSSDVGRGNPITPIRRTSSWVTDRDRAFPLPFTRGEDQGEGLVRRPFVSLTKWHCNKGGTG